MVPEQRPVLADDEQRAGIEADGGAVLALVVCEPAQRQVLKRAPAVHVGLSEVLLVRPGRHALHERQGVVLGVLGDEDLSAVQRQPVEDLVALDRQVAGDRLRRAFRHLVHLVPPFLRQAPVGFAW